MFTSFNVLRLVKDGQTYLFSYDDDNRQSTLRQIALFAANPELSLTWFDAAMLSRKIRETPLSEEANEATAGKQNHTQVAAAMEAKDMGKLVAKCRQSRRTCGPGRGISSDH